MEYLESERISTVIDHLEQFFRDNARVIFIFFNYRERPSYTTTKLLATLSKKLLRLQPRILPGTDRLLSSYSNKKTIPSKHEVFQTLKVGLSTDVRAFVVLDSLDELQGIENSLERFDVPCA